MFSFSTLSSHLLCLHLLSLSPSAETVAVSVSLISIDTPAIDQADYTASCLLMKEMYVVVHVAGHLYAAWYKVFFQYIYIYIHISVTGTCD